MRELWDDAGAVRADLSEETDPASGAILDCGVVVTGALDGAGRLGTRDGEPLRTFREAGAEGLDLFVKALLIPTARLSRRPCTRPTSWASGPRTATG